MKKLYFCLLLLAFGALYVQGQSFFYQNSWGKSGFSLSRSQPDIVQVVFSITSFSIDPVVINGQNLKKVSLPGVFLSNDAGKPDLPGSGRYIAIPQGSTPRLRLTDFQVETIQGVDLSPAPELPLDTQKDIVYPKDNLVYSSNTFYPASPVLMSPVEQIRGTDVVMLGITPFQYNPVTRELKIYKNIKIDLTFEGGSANFGNDLYRSPYWDPIMADNILNFSSLPGINYPARMQQIRTSKMPATGECEYIIICPNGPDFVIWADSLANWRNQQGILTRVFTLADIGGNTETAIQNFIDNAYNTWTIKPAACLLLGDYGTDDSKNIISHLYTHPAGYPSFASDNFYADVNGDEMPDVVFSRIAANNASELSIMVGRILHFERNRPTDAGYYQHPISALGWEDDRWFQLCSELVGGFWKNVLHKDVQRINALYTPANNYVNGPWSTAPNTSTVMAYFGPAGLNYIPDIPGTLGGFTGGNATQINNAINNGAFVLLHRDHGNYTGWGEPAYTTGNINQLSNTLLPFVFSINCETGAYHNPAGCPAACFQETFQRLTRNGHDAGALGLVCPSETSYSFVNDTFLWGVFDNMWPNFMPAYGTNPSSRGVLPAFGNAAGKYFLKQSGWPYNSGDKLVTYRLFHMHGDAFLQLADTLPANLTVIHPATLDYGTTTVHVIANDSCFLSLTVNNEIIATAYGSATGPVALTIPVLPAGTQIMIVATKQDFNRYSDYMSVTVQAMTAAFSASKPETCIETTVNFTDLSAGSPESWNWAFPGGTPATSADRNPSGILYAAAGTYDVTLTVSKPGMNPSTTTQTAYIHVFDKPVAAFTASASCVGIPSSFSDQSSHPGSSIATWNWNFGDPNSGNLNISNDQNPTHTYSNPGIYTVSLEVITTGSCSAVILKNVVINSVPVTATQPVGDPSLCKDVQGKHYTTQVIPDATAYTWQIEPSTAGTISGTGNTATLLLAAGYTGSLSLKVQGNNACGEGDFSEPLPVTVIDVPATPAKPWGADSVNLNKTGQTDFTILNTPGANSYLWTLTPADAGVVSGTGLTGNVIWNSTYRGNAILRVKASGECGESQYSDDKTVTLYSTLGMEEKVELAIKIFPNPNNGQFTLDITAAVATMINITICDVTGNQVYSAPNVSFTRKLNKNIDLSGLSKGAYRLAVEDQGHTYSTTIVIGK